MRVARRYLIGGRVHGVGFRFFTQEAAAREGLHGWVQNLADGRVEIAIEGEVDAVERFEHDIRHGPPSARVVDVEVEDTVPVFRRTGFSIR